MSLPAMRVHHLNCGTMCPIGGPSVAMPALGCHCLLIETDANGLVLVDTGFGLDDIARPLPRLSALLVRLNRIRFDVRDTAIEQVRELGFKPSDVRHLIMTHLDFDHAGGISDFPGATVHVLAAEADAARHRHGFLGRRRYRPAQWRAARWQEYSASGEDWFGFGAVRPLAGLPPEILLVPLPGHSRGHAGVAVQAAGGRWLLHAGDAYFAHDEIAAPRPRAPAAIAAYAWMMQADGATRRQTRDRLRDLVRTGSEVTVICSHDLDELRDRQRAAEGTTPRPARTKAHDTAS
jgi:glyoxylase-like metal-dependent hydrolase (beta-lactamase superfamily II)